MRRVRYSQWEGSPRSGLDADQVFEELSNHLNEMGDLQQAVRRLFHRGLSQDQQRVPGLDELLSRVARELKRLFDRYRLRSALDQVGEKLQSIVEQERETLNELRPSQPEVAEKEKFLDRLPNRWSDAVERLASYDFENQQAQSQFEELLQQLGEIRRLEHYTWREGNLFRGQTPLSFKDAQEMLERIEGLHRLEEQLSGACPGEVDPDLLRSLLGDDAQEDLEGLAHMEGLLKEGGYVVDRGERFELTPRGVRKIGRLALRDIYKQLSREGIGQHPMHHRGSHEPKVEESKPYADGDPFHLHMIQTLKNALLREGRLPLRLDPKDFAVHQSDYSTRASTVLLLDMSWSMSWDGRFAAAKKVALALESLCHSLYPRDYFGVVGFFTRAVELKPKDLPEASWNMGDPFTNLQDGLHLATELLQRQKSRNQQVIIITDGQPTAYCRQGRLYCEWPLSFGGISQRAAEETLKEAERVTRKGITINTFMLDDSPVLREFVEQMTRLNRGRVFFTRPDRLGKYLLVDYVSRLKKRI